VHKLLSLKKRNEGQLKVFQAFFLKKVQKLIKNVILTFFRKMKKDILSIFVDGNELKIVRAKRIKSKIKILSVESIQLKLPVHI